MGGCRIWAWPSDTAVGVYAIIGLVGIFSMPIMGIVADKVVKTVGNEVKGRKIMLVVGPGIGVAACILLLFSSHSMAFAYIACVIFAVYWAIVPGGVVGYTGAIYGRKTLGKIWGLATLIVMGIGPFTGSFTGGLLKVSQVLTLIRSSMRSGPSACPSCWPSAFRWGSRPSPKPLSKRSPNLPLRKPLQLPGVFGCGGPEAPEQITGRGGSGGKSWHWSQQHQVGK